MPTFNGTAGNDVLTGGAGNDTLIGYGGADTLNGGDGDDYLYGGDQSPTFQFPQFGVVPPLLDTGSEGDTLNGGDGSDRIFAGYGDRVDGGLDGPYGDYLYISFLAAPIGVRYDFSLSSQTIGGGVITGIENVSWVQGSNYTDEIYLNGQTNGYGELTAVYGMGGDDKLVAGYYTSSMFGGDGNDIVDGRQSGYLNVVDGGAGNDTLYTNSSGLGAASGGDGNDTIYAYSANGGNGDDVIFLQDSVYGERADGGAGDDELHAANLASILIGGDGDDHFFSGIAVDTIDGGAGTDTIDYSSFTSGVVVNLAAGSGAGGDHLSNVENIIGSAYADTLTGDAGNNTIKGGSGSDLVDGGDGVDTVIFSSSSLNYTFVHTTDGWVVTDRSGADGVDTLKNIEFVQFTDRALGLNDANVIVRGTDAGESLSGTLGPDLIQGLGGNDILYPFSGIDIFDGGAGEDTVSFVQAGVRAFVDLSITAAQVTGTYISIENVTGGDLDDSLRGDAGANKLTGLRGDDIIDGRGGGDTLRGDEGNDTIHGGDGNDLIYGNAGDDQIFGDAGNDVIVFQGNGGQFNEGDDTIDGGDGIDTLGFISSVGVTVSLATTAHQQAAPGLTFAVHNVENLIGTEYADTLTGDAGENLIWGYSGNDVIDGGDGVDTAAFRDNADRYAITQTATGWTVAHIGVGVDGADALKNVEYVQFADKTISLASLIPPPVTAPPVTTPPVVTPPTPTVTLTYASAPVAVSNILRGSTDMGPISVTAQAIANKLAAGIITSEAALQEVIKAADATTSVATMAYQFFTGKIPSAPGLDFLVSPSGPNPNNLNSAYYQTFNLENRYINFAMNLGKVGEGQAGFAGAYGSLSLAEATKKAYGVIFGADPTDAKVAALLADGRDAYFASYGNDGAGGIGTKAAMVGWLLAEAEKAHVGTYAQANVAFLTDLADGASYGVDLVGIYAKPEYALVA
jgi:Ca2+-binding RTX toxin-like protein